MTCTYHFCSFRAKLQLHKNFTINPTVFSKFFLIKITQNTDRARLTSSPPQSTLPRNGNGRALLYLSDPFTRVLLMLTSQIRQPCMGLGVTKPWCKPDLGVRIKCTESRTLVQVDWITYTGSCELVRVYWFM